MIIKERGEDHWLLKGEKKNVSMVSANATVVNPERKYHTIKILHVLLPHSAAHLSPPSGSSCRPVIAC